MTTIKLNNTNNNAKMTRAQAVEYAIQHLENAPVEVMDVLNKIHTSFSKKSTTSGPSKAEIQNRELAVLLGQYVRDHFNADDPMGINARVLANEVPGIMTTQKVAAVVKYADDVQRIKNNGRVAYIPSDVEVVS